MIQGGFSTGTSSGATSTTFSSPNVSGTNRLGVVGVFVQTDLTINSVTWAGQAMTFIGRRDNGGANERVELWYILAPATGVNNIVISRTGSTNGLSGYAEFYTSVKQSAQPDSSATNNATGTTFTLSTTVVADNSWTVAIARNGVEAFSAGTGTTFRNSGSTVLADSNAPVAAGSRSLVFTMTGSNEAWGVIASFAPYTDSSTLTDTETPTESINYEITQIVSDTEATTDSLSNGIVDWVDSPKSTSPTWTDSTKT